MQVSINFKIFYLDFFLENFKNSLGKSRHLLNQVGKWLPVLPVKIIGVSTLLATPYLN